MIKIYPVCAPPWWRFEVKVFDGFGEMYEYARRAWGGHEKAWGLDYRAITLGIRPKKGRLLGEMLFCRKDLSLDTIGHEATHAALWYLQVIRNKEVVMATLDKQGGAHADEEEIAGMVGGLIGQIEKVLLRE